MRNAEKRRVVLEEFHQFYEHEVVPGLRRGGMYLNTDAMADEIVRLRESLASARANRILAALREPSEAVMAAVLNPSVTPGFRLVVRAVLESAVAAAEQEVGP